MSFVCILVLGLIFFPGCSESGTQNLPTLPMEQARFAQDASSISKSFPYLPIQLGMAKETLLSMFASNLVTNAEMDLWQVQGNLGEIPGRWTVSFLNNRVTWFAFSSFEHQINADEFSYTLSRTQEVVDLYSQFLGTPRRIILGITQFKDPTTHQHQGYQVYQAQWEANGSRVVVDFSFVGEGRDYGFLVTVQGS